MEKLLVTGDNVIYGTIGQKNTVINHESATAMLADRSKTMGYENDSLAATTKVLNPARTLVLK